MTTPTFTTPPTAPARTDAPSTFVARADAFVAWIVTFVSELVTAVTWFSSTSTQVASDADSAEASAATASAASLATLGASTYLATSTTSLSVTTSAKAISFAETGRTFANGDQVTLIHRSDNGVRIRGIVSLADMSAKTMTVTPAGSQDLVGSGGPFTDWYVVLSALESQVPVTGRHALWFSASAMTPRTTNGPSAGLAESTTNKVMRRTLDFDASTVEYAQFALRMPKAWDGGTVTFVPEWSHPSTTTNFKTSWGLQAVAVSDDDAGDAAFGTAQYSNDTGGTTDDLYAGPESSAITIAGTPAAEDLVIFQMLRKADDATNDTLAVDARLHGVTVYINTIKGNDA